MSQWRGRIADSVEADSPKEWLIENFEVPIAGALIAVMVWLRTVGYEQYIVDGHVFFSGNDPYYHLRSTKYAVRHWPTTMPFDTWTNFATGTSSGQFGTILDQVVATVALVLGLGAPDQGTVALVLLFTPVVLGVLIALPTYAMGNRLGGRFGGLIALTVLALSINAGRIPNFFARSIVGAADHHPAEALTQVLAILALMIAVTVADRDKPIYEQLVDRDLETLRPTLGWSLVAGIAVTVYLWVWPFGIVLVGIVGTFLLFQLVVEFLRGDSPEHTAIAGAVAMGTVGVASLASISTLSLSPGSFSLIHPLLAFGVAGGCVFMAWLAREFEARDLERLYYPASVAGIILVVAAFTAVVLPDVFGFFQNQFFRIFGLGFDVGGAAGTVGEAQPLVAWEEGGRLGDAVDILFQAYGFAFFVALATALLVLGRLLWYDDVPAEELLVVVWWGFVVAMVFSQRRFLYYLVVPTGVLTGQLAGRILDRVDPTEDLSAVEPYQVLTVLAVVLIVAVPIGIAPVNALSSGQAVAPGPGESNQAWADGLERFESNTPAPGTFGGANNRMEKYETHRAVDDYDYPDGAYGVLSWWDYGHWITEMGNRIPVANPFQQGANDAANFLLAPNETMAERAIEERSEDDAKTRYVAIDWKMANVYSGYGGKFFAPPRFYEPANVSRFDYFQPILYSQTRGQMRLKNQKYYETMIARLYLFHGSAANPQPVVVDWERKTASSGAVYNGIPPSSEPNSRRVIQYDNMSQARAAVANDSTSQIGGFGGLPEERVPALEHYRLVDASTTQATDSNSYNAALLSTTGGVLGNRGWGLVPRRAACSSNVTTPGPSQNGTRSYYCLQQGTANLMESGPNRWVEFFERVPGATIEGEGPANSTVFASVEMQMPNSNETFTYKQRTRTDENGQFTMTVPYSTTGYDRWGPENGHTNVTVRATGPYRFSATETQNGKPVAVWQGNTSVSEAHVNGQNASAVPVDLEQTITFADGDSE